MVMDTTKLWKNLPGVRGCESVVTDWEHLNQDVLG